MTDEAASAFDRLLGSLAEAGRIVTGPIGAHDERERAEGFRHVTRVLRIACEMMLEKGDPRHPAFTRWMDPYRKMLGDNPWTIYDAAVIDGRTTYRIAGTRGTTAYLGICVYGVGEGGARRIIGNLDDPDIAVTDDGTFEVWLAAERPADASPHAGFLALEPDAAEVVVRQYRRDPHEEIVGAYTIQTVPDPGPPPPLTADELARRLEAVGTYVVETVEVEATLSALSAAATPAVLRAGADFVDREGAPADPPIDPTVVARVMPTPAIQYSGTWFEGLGDDEAIVVEGTVPSCRYLSIQVISRWMESGDYLHHPVFATGDDLTLDDEGRFRVTVSHRPPAAGDWVSTTGFRNGNIAVRALLAEGALDIEFRRAPLA